MRQHAVITVDGTAASGKGTLARLLAEAYNGAWLDTGLLYRWVGYRADSRERAIELAQDLAASFDLDMMKDPELRGERASDGASLYSSIAEVRNALTALQRHFADTLPDGRNLVVMDGRDIGTVIVPDAPIKFFVTADIEIRAQRRTKELQSTSNSASYEAVLEAMRQRDARDINRAVAPTVAAPDACLIDTSVMGIPEMLDLAKAHIALKVPELRAVR